MEARFEDWTKEVAAWIRFLADREKVRQELKAHLEDKLARLEATGVAHEAAVTQVVAEMGDAEAVGRALDRVHKRWLGWLWRISQAGLVLGTLLVLLNVLGLLEISSLTKGADVKMTREEYAA